MKKVGYLNYHVKIYISWERTGCDCQVMQPNFWENYSDSIPIITIWHEKGNQDIILARCKFSQ